MNDIVPEDFNAVGPEAVRVPFLRLSPSPFLPVPLLSLSSSEDSWKGKPNCGGCWAKPFRSCASAPLEAERRADLRFLIIRALSTSEDVF